MAGCFPRRPKSRTRAGAEEQSLRTSQNGFAARQRRVFRGALRLSRTICIPTADIAWIEGCPRRCARWPPRTEGDAAEALVKTAYRRQPSNLVTRRPTADRPGQLTTAAAVGRQRVLEFLKFLVLGTAWLCCRPAGPKLRRSRTCCTRGNGHVPAQAERRSMTCCCRPAAALAVDPRAWLADDCPSPPAGRTPRRRGHQPRCRSAAPAGVRPLALGLARAERRGRPAGQQHRHRRGLPRAGGFSTPFPHLIALL